VLWERAPPPNKCGEEQPSQQGLSKELLRRVCEPFFDQMIIALLSVLQGQNGQNSYAGEQDQTAPSQAFGSCFQPSHSSPSLQCVEQMSDEESEPGGFGGGAFSSVLIAPSGTWEAAPASVPELIATKVSGAAKPKDPNATPTIIVCRHWKSKGWCRMEAGCKFSHPDHKCGVGAPNGGKGNGPAALGDAAAGNSNSSDEGGAAGADLKKPGKKRRSKAKGTTPKSQQAGGQSEIPVTVPLVLASLTVS